MRIALAVVAVLAGCARKPAAPVAKAPQIPRGEIPAGTPLGVQLDETISAHHAEEGDPWSASFARPFRDAQGGVIIPAGSKLEGRITNIVPGGADYPARIDLTVERIRTPTRTREITGHMVSSELVDEPRQRTAEQFNRSLGVGTLIGFTLMGVNGAGAGLVSGSAIGAATAVERFERRDALIEAGSFISVELDAPIFADEIR